jgi:hypothetical protein
MHLRAALLALIPGIAAVASCRADGGPGAPLVAGSEGARLKAWISEGALREEYQARDGEQWVVVATAAEGGSAGCTRIGLTDKDNAPAGSPRIALRGGELVEEFEAGGFHVVRRVAASEGPWLHVTTRLEARPGALLHSFQDRFMFSCRPDWSFAPSVGGFVPDAQYKAPLVLVQSRRMAFGLVPDLAALDLELLRQCHHTLDLDVPGGPVLGVGFVPAHQAYHSVYEPDRSAAWQASVAPVNSYYMLVSATSEPAEAYRDAVRLQWRRFGQPTQAKAAIQQQGTSTPADVYGWLRERGPVEDQVALDKRLVGLKLWDEWRAEVWEHRSRQDWLQVPLGGSSVGGGVATRRWGPGPSLYLTAWFNTLRTSLGMALFARRTGDDELLRRARETVEVALRAPGRDGAFKCIAVVPGPGIPVVWAAGDGSGNSTAEGYLGYDMSWTGYWLLRWRSENLPGSDAILERCRALAKFLSDRQAPDGMLPTRFRDDGSVDTALSRTVKAETGPVALFFLELYRQDPDIRWLEAGRRGLAFLEKDVIPQRQWYDFETFWSCSPRGPKLDQRSQQWPANDLALGQSVAAFLAGYRATGERHYLDQGVRVLDYLLLYQQCWTNPLLDHLNGPATLLGGFTTQNSDAEWSDARQSQVGNILLDYYKATGTVEYLERGVAALRAQFPVSPCENWAHSGYGSKTGISSFHWGTGSGMAGIEIDEDYLRDAVVDVAAGRAVGVDGLDVADCSVRGSEISLIFSSPFPWKRSPVFIFHRCEAARSYHVFANGAEVGLRLGSELERGIEIPMAGQR